jgi:flagellar motility protein MotE (MotC chaperone)
MDEEMAAAVLTKLDPRNASAILNEMDAARAARLTATIGGAANVNLPGRSKAQAGEKKS